MITDLAPPFSYISFKISLFFLFPCIATRHPTPLPSDVPPYIGACPHFVPPYILDLRLAYTRLKSTLFEESQSFRSSGQRFGLVAPSARTRALSNHLCRLAGWTTLSSPSSHSLSAHLTIHNWMILA